MPLIVIAGDTVIARFECDFPGCEFAREVPNDARVQTTALAAFAGFEAREHFGRALGYFCPAHSPQKQMEMFG